jgi:tRNA-specific 2-thiouridylase
MTRERVVVAMSGGVDSSVAAALLVEAGCEAIGVTLHLAGDSSRCCSLADADDARRVAERLGIPFYVANETERFRREVTEAFADAYLAGRTPLPCVTCNSRFKFHHLLARARVFGASAVATGHYARVARDPATGRLELRRAADATKDQSYFLYELGPEQLAAARFPLGELTKAAVRAHARRLGLATAEKPESQEICFVPDGDYAAVVERLRPERLPGEGEIVDEQGRVLGRHGGIHRFTVGQRRGLGLASDRRLYVTRLDPARNRVVVGDADALGARGARLARASWVAGAPPRGPIRADVRVRYRHAGAPATVEALPDGGARVAFDAPVAAVAPGQSAVFYAGDAVLGGGPIAEALA